MTDYLSIGPLTRASGPRPPADQQRQVKSGQLNGQRIAQIKTDVTLSENLSEEMTFLSHEYDRRLAKAAKKVKSGLDHLPARVLAKQFAARLSGLTEEDLLDFLDALGELDQSAKTDSAGLTRLAQKNFSDVTRRYLALEFVLAAAADKGLSSQMKDTLAALGEEMMAQRSGDIKGGNNIEPVVAEYLRQDGRVTSADKMRDFYRSYAEEEMPVSESFIKLVRNPACGDLKSSIKFLIKAVGADISSGDPSRQKALLLNRIDTAYLMSAFMTVYVAVKRIGKRLDRYHKKNKRLRPDLPAQDDNDARDAQQRPING